MQPERMEDREGGREGGRNERMKEKGTRTNTKIVDSQTLMSVCLSVCLSVWNKATVHDFFFPSLPCRTPHRAELIHPNPSPLSLYE